MMAISVSLVEPVFDLVGDVGDHLYGASAEVAATFFVKDRPIDFSGGDVGVFGQAFIDEPLVMSQIQICFRAVIGDEDFSVLNGVHGAWVDVDVRIEFLHGDMVASGL